MTSEPAYRVYQPPADMRHIFAITATSINLGPYYAPDSDPELHWRPWLRDEDITRMGMATFAFRYSSFSFVPSRWRLVTEEPLPLGEPVNIVGNIGRGPGVIILQDVVGLTNDGELLVYGWVLSPYQVITSTSGGFLAAVDFVVPYHSARLTPVLRLICSLPTSIAQRILHFRYRLYRTYTSLTEGL